MLLLVYFHQHQHLTLSQQQQRSGSLEQAGSDRGGPLEPGGIEREPLGLPEQQQHLLLQQLMWRAELLGH